MGRLGEGGMPLASSGWRPEMLVNVPQCIGQVFKEYPVQNVNSVSG